MVNWVGALATFAAWAPDSLRWMLVGSAATAVHGVPVAPGDVDILIHPGTDDDRLRELGHRLEAIAGDVPGGSGPADFVSTSHQPWLQWDNWTFGRWIVGGAKLELARITDAMPPTLLVETHGTAVWSVAQFAIFEGRRVQIVPLEVQLATNLSRPLGDRARLIRQHLDRVGVDQTLLIRALEARNLPTEL